MSTSDRVLCTKNNFIKNFIATGTLKKWLWLYHSCVCTYLKNVSVIRQYIFILFNFSRLYYYNLFNSTNNFLQCYESAINFLIKLKLLNSRKIFLQCRKSPINFVLSLILKSET